MKIIVSSDFHGNFPPIDSGVYGEFDLLIIAGDVCPSHSCYYSFQKEWLMGDFAKWINALPYAHPWSKVILVPGNHDIGLERMTNAELTELEMKCDGRLKILRHDLTEFDYPVSDGIDSLTIFGTPYCSIFGNWAFMMNDEALDRKFSQIPEGVDILISHDSPNIGKLGAILEGPWKNDTTGNKVLSKHIERVHPKMFFSGHFHSGNHVPQMIGETLCANVSYVNEDCYPAYEPLVIEYDEEKRKIIMP